MVHMCDACTGKESLVWHELVSLWNSCHQNYCPFNEIKEQCMPHVHLSSSTIILRSIANCSQACIVEWTSNRSCWSVVVLLESQKETRNWSICMNKKVWMIFQRYGPIYLLTPRTFCMMWYPQGIRPYHCCLRRTSSWSWQKSTWAICTTTKKLLLSWLI